ncbi:MAG TPA: hypothetical protein PLW93_04260 [Candidatus Absconditabacterales bacterium]|nr:hypothetical protein [Candidatus Absconditabacterales bacterium]HNG97456.1 hypothetical protein [Candidatus Absconditabacterales bacterium]
MILFSLLLTTSIFVRLFFQVGVARIGIIPVATVVALFFGSGIQSSHSSGIKQYMENHLQSFSRILIMIGVLIILSLYNIGRAVGSLYIIIGNALLLGGMYISHSTQWQGPIQASIVFNMIIYIISGGYTASLLGDRTMMIDLLGGLTGMLFAFWSLYYFIIRSFTLFPAPGLGYQLLGIGHIFIITIIIKLTIGSNPLIGLIITQIYIACVLYSISLIKDTIQAFQSSTIDLDVEYIMRGYRINQIPSIQGGFMGILNHPWIQTIVHHIPSRLTSLLSISSIIATLLFCILAVYYGNNDMLTLGDFGLFLVNIILYLTIFYVCKKTGIQDHLRRFFGFLAINICYFIVVAQVFNNDNVSILFWSILWSVANNLALNYLQDLRSYLGSKDYQYRLMSNFFGLIIIVYFFLGLNLDILFKLAFVVMIVGVRLLLNKDNLKAMMDRTDE